SLSKVSSSRLTTCAWASDYFDGSAGALEVRGRACATGNMRGVPMGAMPSPEQSRLYAGLLPAVERSVETPICAADREKRWSANDEPASREGTTRRLARFAIMFYVGVAATLACESYGDEARQIIASLSPQLSWLAPQAVGAPAVPDANEEITRSIDRIV